MVHTGVWGRHKLTVDDFDLLKVGEQGLSDPLVLAHIPVCCRCSAKGASAR